jgi:hypothetical protein
MSDVIFNEEPIYSYGSNEAVEDGILVDLGVLGFTRGLFTYVTSNLLGTLGYCEDDENMHPMAEPNDAIKLVCLKDLLIQAHEIVRSKSKNFTKFDYFFEGDVEIPSGERKKIFIAQNETGKFTIMLPEDY